MNINSDTQKQALFFTPVSNSLDLKNKKLKKEEVQNHIVFLLATIIFFNIYNNNNHTPTKKNRSAHYLLRMNLIV